MESYKEKAAKLDTTCFPINWEKRDIIFLVDKALQEDEYARKPVGKYEYTIAAFTSSVGFNYMYWFQVHVLFMGRKKTFQI